ncbi:PGG domain [Sesbania bispinosa]|nr:PGG domain [Sesbania bispinosa]
MENLEQLYYTQSQKNKYHEMHKEALLNASNTVVLVVVLIDTVTFAAGISPPGGVYQERPMRGKSMVGNGSLGTIFIGLSVMLVEHLLRKSKWRKKRMESGDGAAESAKASENSDFESFYLQGYHSY